MGVEHRGRTLGSRAERNRAWLRARAVALPFFADVSTELRVEAAKAARDVAPPAAAPVLTGRRVCLFATADARDRFVARWAIYDARALEEMP